MRVEEIEKLVEARLGGDIKVPQSAIETLADLAEFGASVVESVVNWLGEQQDPDDVANYLRILGEVGKPALESLLSFLKDKKADVRRSAVTLLGAIGEPAVEPLLVLLKDDNEASYARVSAADALGKIGDPRAVEPLVKALSDDDEHVRMLAADALGEIGDPRAVEPLVKLLSGKYTAARMLAADALGKIGDPRALEPVVRALSDDDEHVRECAAKALKHMGESAIHRLVELLADENHLIRAGAARVLGEFVRTNGVIEPLILSLWDDEEEVTKAVMEALEKISPSWAERDMSTYFEYFAEALREGNSYVRFCVIDILAKSRNPKISDMLVGALKDKNKNVRLSAARALEGIKKRPSAKTMTASGLP